MADAIPWYKSKIIIGAGVSIVSQLLKASGILPDSLDGHTTEIANVIVDGIGIIGAGVAVGSRVKQERAAPIVGSKAEVKAQLQQVQDIPQTEIDADRLANAAAQAGLEFDPISGAVRFNGTLKSSISAASDFMPDFPFASQADAAQQEQGA